MFTFNTSHIFIGYLKQLLSTFNLPTCKVYTREFADYFENHEGIEDPRVVESVDADLYSISKGRAKIDRNGVKINYLKDGGIFNYYTEYNSKTNTYGSSAWQRSSSTINYEEDNFTFGLTKTLKSTGPQYDIKTHEYLGDFLRFLRDYYDVDLMSLYNCFSNNICNNIYYSSKQINFDYRDSSYRIYSVPVKLFANYTIAIDSSQGIELFCGLYNTKLDTSEKCQNLIQRTYQKIDNTIFNQPFVYDKLSVQYWNRKLELEPDKNNKILIDDPACISRWDILNKEANLRLFIKVPIHCKSSITILEGTFDTFNNSKYSMFKNQDNSGAWHYNTNYSVINFENPTSLNKAFKPISRLQLLTLNTGVSYPFADRLIEYLVGSTITPLDKIPDNIKRVQAVMEKNQHHFTIKGLWEPKIQKIIYDYIMTVGPLKVKNNTKENQLNNNVKKTESTKFYLNDEHLGYHTELGHNSKSTLFDILGYVDKDAEKWYANWIIENKDQGRARATTIQNVDIYDGLYDNF